MSIKERLAEIGLKPSSKFGQNFLREPGVARRIVEFGKPIDAPLVVEIGAGLGALTGELLDLDSNLIAIEIEKKLCSFLRSKYPSIEVINADARFVDLNLLGEKMVVFGNLPYSFSTDILFHLVRHYSVIDKAILLLQKEFADRLCAAPGGRDYGVLTINCGLFGDAVKGDIVPGASFYPKAKVDSMVVIIRFRNSPKYGLDDGDILMFRQVVEASFFRRRKKIGNSLRSSGLFPSQVVDACLE
ncbi:MAG: ribosomal RNA small subunit methyltransferase A, partial [Candidatus Dadabacteria bacterium]